MNITISVINVEQSTKTSKTGKPYQQLEVAFKNLGSGKVESKKVLSYADAAFKALVGAKQGDTFIVDSQKNNETGFWEWVSVSQQAPGSVAVEQSTGPMTKPGFTPSPKSTYETPEERAKKQIYIVKQSSISAAIEALSIGAKTPPTTDAIIKVAQEFVDYVFAQETVKLTPLAAMDDDVPY